ncbi:MAG TPA: ribonuclease H family protein, partial [Chlamydiales bacterium]|nr:ribonuclease H family protein [Chlamydiales bacterium]
LRGLRHFLGLTSYYRRFIKGYADIAAPLNALMQKDVMYHWSNECQKAFEILKGKLTSAPVLAYPDFTRKFYLHTDASGKALGAVLTQKTDDSHEQVIGYASRAMNKAERNYFPTEYECLAVVWAMQYFRPYLYGQSFEVITDHSALKWLMNLKDPNGRLARCALKVQEYEMEITHRPGRLHTNVDALSRIDYEVPDPVTPDDPKLESLVQHLSGIEQGQLAKAIRRHPDWLSIMKPFTPEWTARRVEQQRQCCNTHVTHFCLGITTKPMVQKEQLTAQAHKTMVHGIIQHVKQTCHVDLVQKVFNTLTPTQWR